MTEFIGLISSIAFGICAIPGAYAAIRDKTCSYPTSMLILWAIGELGTLIYTGLIGSLVQWFNLIPNLVCLCILIYYNNKPIE